MTTSTQLKVLLIEDNPPDARMVELCLPPAEFAITTCDRLQSALEAIGRSQYDLILSDLSLPDSNGMDTVRSLIDLQPPLPLVVMTGLDDKDTALTALQEGAQDYLVKEHNNEYILPRALRYAKERHQNHITLSLEKKQHQLAAQRFQTLFDGIPDSLVLFDSDLKILYANQGVEQLFGEQWAADRIVGRSCLEVFCQIKGPSSECLVTKTFKSGRNQQDKFTLEDGRILVFRTFPLKNSADQVVQVIKMAADITDSERVHSEVARTGQLAALGEMAAGVAHEINNPINGIINYATILSQKITDSSLLDIANRIVHEGDRIADIVSKLLSFTREKAEPPRPFSLIEACQTSLALFSTQLRHDGIRLQSDLPEDLPMVLGRPHQIEQVIVNLISNSRYALNVKFPESDERKLLSISARALNDNAVELSFLDYGCGIPDAIQGKIFSPFFSTKPTNQGTGLGLSISLGILQEHSGSLAIKSVENEFTEIRMMIPRAPEHG